MNNLGKLGLNTMRRRTRLPKSEESESEPSRPGPRSGPRPGSPPLENNSAEAKVGDNRDNGEAKSDDLDVVRSPLQHFLGRKGANRNENLTTRVNQSRLNDNSNITYDYSDRLKHMRKSPPPPKDYGEQGNNKSLFKPPLRSVAESIPEVHFIGEVCKGFGFPHQHSYSSSLSSISCKWTVEWGDSFSLLAGECNDQTQYSLIDENDRTCIWNHPIDLHFVSASMKGWPRIIVQLWELDKYGRTLLVGFGFAHLPSIQGKFQISKYTTTCTSL